jgi:cytochrome c553
MKQQPWLWLCAMALVTTTQAHAAGSASAGKIKAESCAGCHGENGIGNVPMFPKLSAQKTSYLIKQLNDFKSGKRPEPTMSAMAAAMSDEDMADLSAYFAEQKLSAEPAPVNERGRTLFLAGDPDVGLPACTGCHGPEARGNEPAAFPALHGQYSAYLAKTLHDFKTESRYNDPNKMMRSIAGRLSDDDIAAVSDYLASMQ